MAYTTPRTFVTGEVETASIFNTYLRDNDAWALTDSPTCRAYNSTTFSHNSSGNWLSFTLNSERFDNAAMHDTVTNTSRITIPTGGAGKYLLGGTCTWAVSAAGAQRAARFAVNNTSVLGVDNRPPSASIGSECMPCTVWSLAAADYVEFAGNQDSGGTLAVGGNPSGGPEFFAFWFRT